MNDELQALEKMHTWDSVDLSPSKRPIGCKWIYKIKTHSDGIIERYKARLVMDVKNAFLNGTLSEEDYMKPPPGTSPPPHKVIFDLQHYLRQHFEMKDFGITDSNIASTHLDPNVHLTPYDGVPLEDVSLYQQLVGSLIYLTMTRPNIAYVVHIVSQFMATPRTIHFTDVLRILRYIKGTLGMTFSFLNPLSYFLAILMQIGKKQSVVSRSSTKSEYCALADATTELLWLRWLLVDMGVPQQGPTLLHCDSRNASRLLTMMPVHTRFQEKFNSWNRILY
ncbi:putative mitochondrial protein [Cucumis melo var. makuwa]|uniref:Mitochondrial protein n=1 Tax=Cucumis melo var. makuwa TaxID=1194695 RepID=A0A5A7U9M0_CUCMM|nr:putative mitochondrial protein [Cucumis melo var. makuwa]TYK04517.1 putative mitochondrial protein [Cucumis melo var. makuwa]